MMRKIDYEEWQSKRASFLRERARMAARRAPSSKLRDPEERELLIRLDKARLEKWKKEGRLKVIGSRHYKFSAIG
jgi:hypothetical protein